jgi:polyisoprenyl-teichoic acid--peptidoglycan teichoic acid transferase
MIRRAVALIIVVGAACVLIPATGAEKSKTPTVTVGRVHKSFQPTKGKIFVLVIGSDARNGNPNLRADAIHIAGINTRTMRGGILNFPRDSYVNIPGHGSGKINEALYQGGPELLARTLENLTHIRIDYYVLVGFEGFQRIIDGVGGVTMRFGSPINDQGGSGAHIPAGKVKLGPRSALAYVRTRKAFSGGDIARTTNQARFLIALLRKLRAQVESDPTALLKWIAITRRHTRIDIGPEELFRLGILTSQVRRSRVKSVTVPVSIGSVGAASVVFIQSGANQIYARFRKKGSL